MAQQAFFAMANVPVSARSFIIVAVTVGVYLALLAVVVIVVFLDEVLPGWCSVRRYCEGSCK